MYGAGTELYEYLTELAEDKFEEELQTTERTFVPKQAKQYTGYVLDGTETNTKRKAKAVGKETQGHSKARSAKGSR